eukprot:gene9948-7819_t
MSALACKRSIVSLRTSSRSVVRPLPSGLFVKRTAVAQTKFVVRAEAEAETSSIDTEKMIKDAQEKFDAIENKPQVALYGVGGVFALFLTSQLLGAINHVPLVPKMFELIGLGYSSWFTYRYLLFKSGRQELLQDVEALQAKISSSE